MDASLSGPRDAEAWEWDDRNEGELAAHVIRLAEVEQVWANDPILLPNRKHRAGDWKMVGLTNGGRALTIILRYNEDRRTLRAITGWEATPADHARYL